MVENLPAMRETWVPSLGREDHLKKGITRLVLLVLLELQSSCLENSMDRGGWGATVHSVTKSQTRLSDWHEFTYIYSCSRGSVGKESTYNIGDLGLILVWGGPLEKGKAIQYSGLENSMDSIVNWVAKRVTFTSFHNWTTFTSLHSSSCSKNYIHYLFFSQNSFPEGYFFFLAWRVTMCLSQKKISSTS